MEDCSEEERTVILNSHASNLVASYHNNIIGYTPLHFAAESGNLRIVKMFLDYGANVNAMADIGSPLHVSVIFNKKVVFHLLLEYGADINIVYDGDQNAYRHVFDHLDEKQDIVNSWIYLLHGNGCNINYKDSLGNTPLFYAHDVDIEYMLKCGADINIINNEGKTAFVAESYYLTDVFYLVACKHIIKLDAINFYVADHNKNFLANAIRSKNVDENELITYKKKCLDTINYLKKVMISSNQETSMYDIYFF